jgi:hypothetical protein
LSKCEKEKEILCQNILIFGEGEKSSNFGLNKKIEIFSSHFDFDFSLVALKN